MACTLLASVCVVHAGQVGAGPVKIFIMAGQSNMQGHGNMSPVTTRGTLEYTVANDRPRNYRFAIDGDGDWAQWEDVWIHYERSTSTLLTGNLTAGYGASNTTIGPELGFGSVMGDYYGHQVLLVKAAWGGKSLEVDFRPPRSGGTTGFYYNEILRVVDDAITNLGTYFPDYDEQGYEIVGFAWHQGWNDRVNQDYNNKYEANMVNFIHDIRGALGVPKLPFVIATTGMSGWEDLHPRALSLMNAQLAVPTYRGFSGNVFTVETRGFWREIADSPADQSYHWNRNAATYLDIGVAMGEAMKSLLDDYGVWGGYFPGVDLSDPDGDLDGDKLPNDEERIWGLDPTNNLSINPISVPLDGAGEFQYTRRDPALSGLGFTVWTSLDMDVWAEDTGAAQNPGAAVDGVETVEVTLSAALLVEADLFVRVHASE